MRTLIIALISLSLGAASCTGISGPTGPDTEPTIAPYQFPTDEPEAAAVFTSPPQEPTEIQDQGDETPALPTHDRFATAAAQTVSAKLTQFALQTEVPPTPQREEPSMETGFLGYSAGGREIDYLHLSYYNDKSVVIVVGSIDGYQQDTRDVLLQVISQAATWPFPSGTEMYIIPSINPDGNAKTEIVAARVNENEVDLNRNWDTPNWTPDPPLPGFPDGKEGAGGRYPNSEPETQALASLVMELNEDRDVFLVVLHSSVNISQGKTFPGYTVDGFHFESDWYARNAANILGYEFSTEWVYDTPGELIHWAGINDIPAIDILWPRGTEPSVEVLLRAILSKPDI